MRIEGGFIQMILHWQGGDHTALNLKINGAGKHRWTVPEDTLSLIRELARLMPDQQIARLLNRAGEPVGGCGYASSPRRRSSSFIECQPVDVATFRRSRPLVRVARATPATADYLGC